MKRYNITVNGKVYDVQVEEVGASAPAAPAGSCCGPGTCCRSCAASGGPG